MRRASIDSASELVNSEPGSRAPVLCSISRSGGMVDTLDSKSSAAMCVGSSPTSGTKIFKIMSFLQQHIYFSGILLYFLIFIIIYIRNKENRKEMLLVGSLFGICGVILSHYAIRDYWHPNYIFKTFRVEDFFYGMSYGATITFFPHLFFKKTLHVKKKLWFLVASAVVTGITFILFLYIYKVNSIVSYIVPLLFVGSLSIYTHKQNLKYQIYSGLLSTLLTFIIFKLLLLIEPRMFYLYWKIENITGIFILNIPIEEYLFAFMLGFGGSMFYDTVAGNDPRT